MTYVPFPNSPIVRAQADYTADPEKELILATRGYVDANSGTGPQGPKGDKGDTGATGATGTTGATGATGAAGANGTNGLGVPAGGTTSQVLTKKSNADNDTDWETPSAGSGNPTGALLLWATTTAPTGYLLCYGQLVSTTIYSALYAVIGTTYGSGSGTFGIPDLRGRFPLGLDLMGGGSATGRVTSPTGASLNESAAGEEKHAIVTAEMAAHSHQYDKVTGKTGGALFGSGTATVTFTGTATDTVGSGTAHNNMPPYLTICYIIKT